MHIEETRNLPHVMNEPRIYNVSSRDKEPLVRFIRDALEHGGCRLLSVPTPDKAPFRFTFETREGERMGIMVYAFLANSKVTKNRPGDEHRFQVKYGPKDGLLHEVWQDPHSLYTTLFCGIDPERGIFVGADPVCTIQPGTLIPYEISSAKQAERISTLCLGWHQWERESRK